MKEIYQRAISIHVKIVSGDGTAYQVQEERYEDDFQHPLPRRRIHQWGHLGFDLRDEPSNAELGREGDRERKELFWKVQLREKSTRMPH